MQREAVKSRHIVAGRTWALAILIAALFSCAKPTGESVGRSRQAIFSGLTISGEINDANGLPLPGVTVTLAGSLDVVQTDANGNYSFTGLAPGSYSVRPTFNGCSFVPDVVNLNNLNASTTQDFNGSGPSCGGTPSVNVGAMSGPVTISGLVSDSAGNAVVGAEITLGGNGNAARFTDFTGRYAFHVSSGSYSLST